MVSVRLIVVALVASMCCLGAVAAAANPCEQLLPFDAWKGSNVIAGFFRNFDDTYIEADYNNHSDLQVFVRVSELIDTFWTADGVFEIVGVAIATGRDALIGNLTALRYYNKGEAHTNNGDEIGCDDNLNFFYMRQALSLAVPGVIYGLPVGTLTLLPARQLIRVRRESINAPFKIASIRAQVFGTPVVAVNATQWPPTQVDV